MNKDNQFKYMIVWEKWKEPENEKDWTNEGISYEEKEEQEYEDDDSTQVIGGLPFQIMQPMMPVKIVTEKDFNFWMGHTNFPISSAILELMAFHCPGVEAIDILTPYRFRLAVAKLFKPNEVMAGITQVAIGHLQTNHEETQPNIHQ